MYVQNSNAVPVTSKILSAGTNLDALPPSTTEATIFADKSTISAPLTSHDSNTLFIRTIDDSHVIKAKRAADEASEAIEAQVGRRIGDICHCLNSCCAEVRSVVLEALSRSPYDLCL